MQIKRIVTILLPKDPDLLATVQTFQQAQQELSKLCYNSGNLLGAIAWQRKCYQSVKGKLSAQMTISAIRLVAAAYKSARANKKLVPNPFSFNRAKALFLVRQRGTDADCRADGMLSIWTVGGRKRLTYQVPEVFEAILSKALQIDSLTVFEGDGKLFGQVAVTLEAPEARGLHPVGIDLMKALTATIAQSW
jgi:hypothetical protein